MNLPNSLPQRIQLLKASFSCKLLEQLAFSSIRSYKDWYTHRVRKERDSNEALVLWRQTRGSPLESLPAVRCGCVCSRRCGTSHWTCTSIYHLPNIALLFFSCTAHPPNYFAFLERLIIFSSIVHSMLYFLLSLHIHYFLKHINLWIFLFLIIFYRFLLLSRSPIYLRHEDHHLW